jgi:hypothetical protein
VIARVASVAGCLLVLGCSAPPPPLPAGIAELRLPEDSHTLARIAAEDDPTGALGRRRDVLANVAGQLLDAPPADPLVPELFDLLTALAPRIEAAAISPAWGSYVYTSYRRDLVQERPTGVPRRSAADVQHALDGYVEFYRLRAREDGRSRTIEDAGFEDTREWRREQRESR